MTAMQSPLAPNGPHASQIAEMAWTLIAGAAIVYAVVVLVAVYALRTGRRCRLSESTLVVGGGIVFPSLVLCALFAYSMVAGSALRPASEVALRIEVTGEMWWWRVRYLDSQGKLDFVTANEIHLPAGASIEISLRSADVIHSFWMPGLAGMLDMIPGRVNTLRFVTGQAGDLRGQCTEFCGMQHARMAFDVRVHDGAAFERWRTAQRGPAQSLHPERHAQGQALFMGHCARCHAVRGTTAAGTSGPDLTHVGSRRSIAAGLLPNNAGTMAAWIASSQHLKPGNRMPAFAQFSGAELTALASYVASLQ